MWLSVKEISNEPYISNNNLNTIYNNRNENIMDPFEME